MSTGKGSSVVEFLIVACLLFGGFQCIKHLASLRHREKVTLYQLKPTCQGTKCKGAYTFKNEKGIWWDYDFDFSLSSDLSKPYASFGNTLPRGGTWVKGNEPKDDEEMDEEEMDVTESSDDSPNGDGDSSSSSDSGDSGGDGGGGD